MAAERASGDEVLAAVREARRIRGAVVLHDGDEERWGAFVSAVDGSLEVRTGDPPKRWWQRTTEPERWLRDHGYAHVVDAWSLPLPAATSDDKAAALLREAMIAVFDATELRRGYVGRGVRDDDVPDACATHDDHVAAALWAVASGHQRGVSIGGGRPEALWAWAWAVDGELLIEREERGKRESGTDVWREPPTAEGCRRAAEELMRRTRAEWPEADHVPLFLHLLEHDD